MLKKTIEILVVFRDIKREEVFKNKYKIGINSFARDRKLGFDKIMTMMIKKSNKSIQNSITDTQLDLGEYVTISNSAYTQARAKLNYTAFKEFAKDVSQARVSCLYGVLNNIAIDSSISNKNKSKENNLIAYDERTLAVEHLQHCNKDDLTLMDRGYPSFELFASAYNKTNIFCRLRRNVFSKAKFLFDAHSEKKDVILEINAPKYLKETLRSENIPTKMKIRFVQVILDNGTVEVLCTNITDNERLKTSEFKELYALRWGIETYFDLIKNRLSLENFTGQSALAVKQDFFATIFLTNYESILTYDINDDLKESTKDNKYVQKVNKAVSFNVIKHKVFDLLYLDNPIDEILEQMEKLFLTNTIVIRPNRKSKPRLDKDIHKSTIATNSINHLKRKKKNVGN